MVLSRKRKGRKTKMRKDKAVRKSIELLGDHSVCEKGKTQEKIVEKSFNKHDTKDYPSLLSEP